jgi:two-component system response regulator
MTQSVDPNRTILIVEDSPDDFEVAERAFKESNLLNPIHHCGDGDSALEYLYDETIPVPGIILLDLNMPGTDGREVLDKLKKDKNFKDIPVVILTTSSDQHDIDDCYRMGANTYIQKPVDLDNFFDAIKRLKEYWFEIAILPRD